MGISAFVTYRWIINPWATPAAEDHGGH